MKRLAALFVVLLSATANAQWAEAVSAEAAALALARGATVVDVRPAGEYIQGHLPGAVLLDATAALSSREALQDMVSRQGVDLSREVLVVGLPGDPLAQRLQKYLGQYATGRVSWLVGGAHEWALSGRPLETRPVARHAVPQHLVALQPALNSPRMAGAALRDPSARLPSGTTANATPAAPAI